MEFSKKIGIAVAAFVAVGALAWAAFNAIDDGSSAGVALIEADNTPYKSRPTDAQGMDIPHQDKMVFSDSSSKTAQIERIMPGPEQPVIDGPTMAGNAVQPMLATEPVTVASGAMPQAATAQQPTQPASAPAEMVKKDAAIAMGRVVEPVVVPASVQTVTQATVAKTTETAAAFDAAKASAKAQIAKVEKSAAPAVQKLAQNEAPVNEEAPAPMIPETTATPAETKVEEAPVAPTENSQGEEPNMAMEPVAKQVKKAAGGSRYQLASFFDRPSAERAVSSFAKKYGKAISASDLSIVEATAKGRTVYRVQGTDSAPASVCKSVKSMGGTCVVVK